MRPESPALPGGLPDGVHAVHLAGDLEAANLTAFEIDVDRAIARGELAVVVDLSDAAFVASAAVNAMFRVCRKLRQAGGALAVVCDDPQALRVIEITGLDQAATVCGDLDAALRALDPYRGGFH